MIEPAARIWHARGQGFKSPQLHQAQRNSILRSEGRLSADCQQITPCDDDSTLSVDRFDRLRCSQDAYLREDFPTTSQGPALRAAAFGRPPARRRHDGYRGTASPPPTPESKIAATLASPICSTDDVQPAAAQPARQPSRPRGRRRRHGRPEQTGDGAGGQIPELCTAASSPNADPRNSTGVRAATAACSAVSTAEPWPPRRPRTRGLGPNAGRPAAGIGARTGDAEDQDQHAPRRSRPVGCWPRWPRCRPRRGRAWWPILARSAIAVRLRDDSRVTAEDPSLDQPCRPTLVMSCRARTRHTYNGTRRDGRMM